MFCFLLYSIFLCLSFSLIIHSLTNAERFATVFCCCCCFFGCKVVRFSPSLIPNINIKSMRLCSFEAVVNIATWLCVFGDLAFVFHISHFNHIPLWFVHSLRVHLCFTTLIINTFKHIQSSNCVLKKDTHTLTHFMFYE